MEPAEANVNIILTLWQRSSTQNGKLNECSQRTDVSDVLQVIYWANKYAN